MSPGLSRGLVGGAFNNARAHSPLMLEELPHHCARVRTLGRMERHGVVAAGPRVRESLHAAHAHHAPTAAEIVATRHAVFARFAQFTGFSGALRNDPPVPPQKLTR